VVFAGLYFESVDAAKAGAEVARPWAPLVGNAVNRLAGSRGIQIEQSARLRQLPDARGRVAQSIAEALVAALG
jgi:hypothetical protein